MPNEDRIDYAEMEFMNALLRFKNKHGANAYCGLLRKFNAQRYSEIPSNQYGQVIMTCHAGGAGLKIEDAEEVEDSPSVQDQLSEIAAKVYGVVNSNDDFATVVNSAPTLQEGLNLAARAIHARRPVE